MCVARWARALWIPSTDRVKNLILELYASEAPLENLSSGVGSEPTRVGTGHRVGPLAVHMNKLVGLIACPIGSLIVQQNSK